MPTCDDPISRSSPLDSDAALEKGVELVVKEFLGRASIGVTATVYAHVRLRLQRQAAALLGQTGVFGYYWTPRQLHRGGTPDQFCNPNSYQKYHPALTANRRVQAPPQ